MAKYSHLQEPIAIGGVMSRNRVMMTTHGPRLAQARYVRYLEERAKGGIGLAGFNLGPMGLMQFPLGPGKPHPAHAGAVDTVPYHPLTKEGRAFYDAMIPALREQSEAVTKHGVLSIAQLYHPGVAQHTDVLQPVVGPSVVPDEYEHHVPHELTGEEIADLIETYAVCAKRAVAAGFSGIELHAAHGYIGQQFLSPVMNKRTDKYGGSLENRMRFLLETAAAVRDAIRDEIPVGLRMTGSEPEGGLTEAEIVETARRMAEAGMAYLSISGGTYSGRMLGANRPYVAPAFVSNGPNVPAAAAVKKVVNVPVMVAGNIADVAFAESVVADGKADIVGMVRGLIADPQLLTKAFAGQEHRITPCIACNECHYGVTVRCSVNPAVGQEAAFEAAPLVKNKNVLVIGAGPAGMECAVAAARRGHHVTLADQRGELGGMLSILARTSEQSRFGDYLAYMKRTLDEASVEMKLNTAIDAGYVKWLGPDAVVIATGAAYEQLPDGAVSAEVALESPKQLGVRVAVAGGLDDHLPSLVVADYLSRHGYQVTLLSENPLPGQSVEPASLYMMLRRFSERGVELKPLTAALRLEGDTLITRNSFSNAPGRIERIDSLVVADGRKPVNGLSAQLKGLAKEVHVIGDALAPRRMLHATIDGVRLGQTAL